MATVTGLSVGLMRTKAWDCCFPQSPRTPGWRGGAPLPGGLGRGQLSGEPPGNLTMITCKGCWCPLKTYGGSLPRMPLTLEDWRLPVRQSDKGGVGIER
jgi:hypothetical protein